jgi:hypothetical protein
MGRSVAKEPVMHRTQNCPFGQHAAIVGLFAVFIVMSIGNPALAEYKPLQCNLGQPCGVDDIIDIKLMKSRLIRFQSDIKNVGMIGNIRSCDEMIVEGVAHDLAYGAVCHVVTEDGTRDWIVCDDDMVGNLGLELGGGGPPKKRRDYVINYTRDHCLGG